MELILSYDNQDHKIKKELLFNYNYNNPIHNFMFQYQRHSVIIDTRTYKYLVAMSKNATRYSLLEIPFRLDKVQKATDSKHFFDTTLYKIPHDTFYIEIKNNFIYKSKKSIIRLDPIFGDLIFNKHFSLFENIYSNIKYGKHYSNVCNIYVSNYAKLTSKSNFSLYKNYIVNPKDNKITNYFKHYSTNKYFYVNLYRNDSLTYKVKRIYINQILNVPKYNSKNPIYIIKEIRIKTHDNYVINPFNDNINYFLDRRVNNTNIYDSYFLTSNFNFSLKLYENNNIYKNPDTKLVLLSADKFLYKNIHTLNVLESINTSKDSNNELFYFNEFNPLLKNKIINFFNKEDFLSSSDKYFYLKENVFVKVSNKFLKDLKMHLCIKSDNNYILNIFKNDSLSDNAKQMYYQSSETFGLKEYNHLTISETYSHSNKYANKLSVIGNVPFSLFNKNLGVISNNEFLSKGKNNLYIYDHTYALRLESLLKCYEDGIHINKYYNHLSIMDYVFANTYNKNIYSNFINVFAGKYNNRLSLHNILFTYKGRSQLYLQYSNVYVNNFNKNLNYKDLDKIIGFDSNNKNLFLNNHSYAFKNYLSIDILNDLYQAIKDNKFIKNIHMYIGFYKETKNLYVNEDNINNIIKYCMNINLLENNQDSIISFNKYGKNLLEYNLLDTFAKQNFNIQTLSGSTVIKSNYNLNINNEPLLSELLSKDTNFIEYIKDGALKTVITTNFYNEDIFVTNKPKNIFLKPDYIQVLKIFANVTLFKDFTGINVKQRNIFINRDIHIFKQKYDITLLSSILFITKKITSIKFIRNEEWLSQIKPVSLFADLNEIDITKHIYVSLNYIDVLRKNKDIRLYNDMNHVNQYKHAKLFDETFVNNKFRDIDIYSKIESIKRRSDFSVSIFENFYVSTPIKTLENISPNFDFFTKVVIEAQISSDPITDWAWVYEEEEDFEDPFKIDELLLPENDSRYEDFEDLIFDKKTLKPRNFVKKIDDYTFIAKLPIKYPFKDDNGENVYKDVAVEYLDVRTGIMRQVFLGYYKLWQDHIFDFAKMTMVQACKKILDYLYAWILMYFSLEDMPEALRVFRLIRWYLERSLLQNSEYVVSYEPGNLTSGTLSSNTLDIPSDINPSNKYSDESQNMTMYIDTSKHIIRNHEDFLNQEAHITFYIENRKDTKISFYLHTLTPVNIILNGKVIDTISLPTTGKMVYNIPYTEDFNSFTIQKTALNNINTDFYIGNITIYNAGMTGNLDIKFNPKLQGNMLLDNVSKKVISYMNLYENNDELIQNLLNGNIHLDKLYNDLLTYWDLHHQDKDKGKRLTIKRT